MPISYFLIEIKLQRIFQKTWNNSCETKLSENIASHGVIVEIHAMIRFEGFARGWLFRFMSSCQVLCPLFVYIQTKQRIPVRMSKGIGFVLSILECCWP